ncbi:MFS transporter [Erythrobacter sp. YJ-T3-07]|nr:MFS transporter [Erythrobacter sp. YJ-T3-07]
MGGASIPYLLGSEIPNAALREKTQSLGAAWNVIWAFVTNFVLPYMISNLHFGVGWVFGSISVVAFVFTFFFLPETKVSNSSSRPTSLAPTMLILGFFLRTGVCSRGY